MKLNTAMKQLVLADCSVFQNLDRAVLSLLAETARAEVFLPGELLVEVDEEADCAFVIIEGRVGVLVPGVDEPIHHMGPGDSVGEYGMFGGVRIATVRAEERTRALAIEYRSLKACLLQHPDAMYDLLATTVARLRATSEQLAAANAR